MNELVRALLSRLVPGESPKIPVPQQSVMDPSRPDPLSRAEFDRGTSRGMLDVGGGLPDMVTAGINRLPGLPGALVRGAVGKNPLPTDALARPMGLEGEGPAFDTGRATTNALAGVMGLGANMRPPPAGQVNMLIGPGAPGYDMGVAKKLAADARKRGIVDDRELAKFFSQRGQVFDPNSRHALQYVDTSSWAIDPKRIAQLKAGQTGKFAEMFPKSNPMVGDLPPGALGADVTLGTDLKGAAFHPNENRIVLSKQSLESSQKLRDHLFHEGQHAVQQAQGLSTGTNPQVGDAVDKLMEAVRDRRSEAFWERINPSSTSRWPEGGKRLTRAFSDLDAKRLSSGFKSYHADVGEQIAREASDVAEFGVPGRGLNVFDNPKVNIEPTINGVPQDLSNFLQEARARHPVMFKKMLTTHPELGDLLPAVQQEKFREMLGARPFLGVGVPSPLDDARLARRGLPPKP